MLVRFFLRAGGRRSWTVRCRDERGRNATTVVALTEQFVVVENADRETIRLSAAQVDRLRVALRAAVISLGTLDGNNMCASPAHTIPVQRSSGLPRGADHSNG
ncbi:hypothetical protein G7043_03875 [Lentzea sp. NEAU-D13]|uniref:Uncharacterized protein n=1 Tax=Lentzea alba TaxID=2714351 RepID=A0A7C9RMD6_9PSEU|nr:hypothetical protein [Lentzea alba]NGY58068.1 hypothetical protein [Lentzea alba]